MKKHLQFLALATAILLALAACSPNDPTGTPASTEPPPPLADPTAIPTNTSAPSPVQAEPTLIPSPTAITKPVDSPTLDTTYAPPPEPTPTTGLTPTTTQEPTNATEPVDSPTPEPTPSLTPTVAPEPTPTPESTPVPPPTATPTHTPAPTETPPADMTGNAVNDLAHDFTLPSVSGNIHSLQSYREDKSVVLVFYRAFW